MNVQRNQDRFKRFELENRAFPSSPLNYRPRITRRAFLYVWHHDFQRCWKHALRGQRTRTSSEPPASERRCPRPIDARAGLLGFASRGGPFVGSSPSHRDPKVSSPLQSQYSASSVSSCRCAVWKALQPRYRRSRGLDTCSYS